MNARRVILRAVEVSALCLAPLPASLAADADDIAELKRAIEALRQENRALSERLSTLETEQAGRGAATRAAPANPASPPATAGSTSNEQLERRVKDLEDAKTAQEDATRSIIQQSFAKLGPKINEVISLGGTLEVTPQWTKDFSGQKNNSIQLSSASLEFDIQPSNWVFGRLKIDWNDGTNVLFPTTSGFNAGVDRFTLDQGYVTLGDTQRFPPFLTAGRVVLPFGVSTGHPVTDTLSINNPLTVEVFETKQTAVGFGLAFPRPALKPATPPVIVPPVRPLVVAPFVSAAARSMGYEPLPARPPPPAPFSFPPTPPPFNTGVYFYDSQIPGAKRTQLDATAGFHTRGHCGRPYDQLGFGLCPWALNLDVNYNSSVFDAQFLRDGYQSFLPQIGAVPGMAASLKAALGPFSVVGEWNGAIRQARFVNSLGSPVGIKPSAWQVSLGYQFDWNPWVQEIGQQGTFVSVAYSQSSDLAGTTASLDGTLTRVGFVPKSRLLLTAGEWVLETVRVAAEYAYNKDYPVSQGGTGNSAPGFFVSLTYAF
jgi:cell division protein FtsB